jgi:hypothetical protein
MKKEKSLGKKEFDNILRMLRASDADRALAIHMVDEMNSNSLILKICDVTPQTYWQNLPTHWRAKWIDAPSSKVYKYAEIHDIK